MVLKKKIPLIDLRTSKAKINERQTEGKFHIIDGNLNVLEWVVLKCNIVVADKYDIALGQMSI